ncbi:glycosyltransferase family 87 protein [Streptomyces sp. H10-C2]|uniref:glycosyltransferase family 87 protein n=1 Tax=unclassified Streptomyces TaxID=2593676 RepID=UPI0024BB1803|nr:MULTISPECIES: glycosyltransferase family 87 protein [unclassified Streptomyces]MDJ0340875.1 glycosyltransferase family 87 protein [Streptomyces sp. PH10-H1]MDJ0371715.1 glycosyltransferase family 87 protein [Streptomyces sp. H10-C2]
MGVRTVCTSVLVAALTAVVAVTIRSGGSEARPQHLLYWYAAAWALFTAAVWAVRRIPVRAAVIVILVGSAALSVAALTGPPRTSSDMYRYAWDGRVQAAGISPYAYPPAAPQLAGLRDDWLFPPGPVCAAPDLRPVGPVCTRINRPSVNTIYPPVAEGWFLAVHALSPDGARHKPTQIAGAALAVGTTVALLLVLRRRGDPRRAALWAWCPAVSFAAVNDAHVDTLGVLLTVVAFGTSVLPRRGALLGAAIAVKLLPAIVLPGALARRGPRDAARVLVPAVLVIALAYLPYILTSGVGVLGYLPGYLQEEGYESGGVHRFALLRLFLPDSVAAPLAMALIALTALHVLRRGDPGRPWSGALLVTGTALLLTSPSYYWYALLVVALVALDGRWEWLAVPAAGTVLYIGNAMGAHGSWLQSWSYGTAAAVVLAGAALRARRAARGRERPAPAAPHRTGAVRVADGGTPLTPTRAQRES